MLTGQKTKKQLVSHVNYSILANCEKKVVAILREIWNFSQFFKIFMYLFHDFLQNH